MSYRLPDHLPTDREPHAVIPSVVRPSHIVVDNGTITRVNIPCFYARRFTRRDRMIWDHMTWPSPDHPDGSDYSDVLAIADVNLEEEGYTEVRVMIEDAPDGLYVTGDIEYNHVRLTISAICEDANDEDVHVRFAVYLRGSDPEVGQLLDLVTKGTLHIKAGYVGGESPGPEPPVPDTYTITYVPNGASGSTHTQTVSEGGSVTLISNPFVRVGYDFMGWNTRSDGSGAYYSEHQTITPTSDMTLYAQWSGSEPGPDEYVITYYQNGGSGSTHTQTVTAGDTATTIDNPFYPPVEGYTFVEWNTMPDGSGTSYPEQQEFTPESNMSLYAQWSGSGPGPSPTEYIITYYPNGASGAAQVQHVNAGGMALAMTNPFTRPGYTFSGWNTSPNGYGTSYSENQLFTPTSDMSMFAQWESNPYYVISYNPNGGYGTMPSRYVPRGTYTFLDQNRFMKQGATFSNWNTNPYGRGTSYSDGQHIYPTSDLTLYAIWR